MEHKVPLIVGWCEDDGMVFTPYHIQTPQDTADFIATLFPALTHPNLQKVLAMYPESEFSATHYANGSVIRPAQQYRAGRIVRDTEFTCQGIFYYSHLHHNRLHVNELTVRWQTAPGNLPSSRWPF